jgi:hypothetical protein
MIVRTRHLQTMTAVIRRLRGMIAPTRLGLQVNIDRIRHPGATGTIRRLQTMIGPTHHLQDMIDPIRRRSRGFGVYRPAILC